MEYVRLGKSDLEVSRVALGAWLFGRENWGQVDDSSSIQTIQRAIDEGINLIDTAVGYSDSEEVVGEGIKGRRGRVYIATKCGADPSQIPLRVDESLKRLGVDCIDLYQIHYPSFDTPIADSVGALEEQRRLGKVRYIGVCNFSRKQLEEAVATAEITSCQSPYNLLWREIEVGGVLDYCRARSIGVLPYSPIAQGLLAGRFRKLEDLSRVQGEIRSRNVLYQEGVFERALDVLTLMDEVASRYGKTLSQVALNWLISRPGVTSVLTGTRDIRQLEENMGAVGWTMSPEDVHALDEAGQVVSGLLDYSRNMWGNKYSR